MYDHSAPPQIKTALLLLLLYRLHLGMVGGFVVGPGRLASFHRRTAAVCVVTIFTARDAML